MSEATLGEWGQVSLDRQPWRTGAGEFWEATPGFQVQGPRRGSQGEGPPASGSQGLSHSNSPCPFLLGCLPQTHPAPSPRVDSNTLSPLDQTCPCNQTLLNYFLKKFNQDLMLSHLDRKSIVANNMKVTCFYMQIRLTLFIC